MGVYDDRHRIIKRRGEAADINQGIIGIKMKRKSNTTENQARGKRKM